jgi:predicted phage terminase large subunit-like protein
MAIEVHIPKKLYPIFKPMRYKVMHGGRGGGKSQTIARVLLAMGAQKKLRILCAREVQKSLRDSVYKLLSDLISEMKLDVPNEDTGGFSYEVQNNTILGSNGTEFVFTGLLEQTMSSIKSFEGVDICWIEEAHSVSEVSWDILVPTIRKPGSELWISFNPTLEEDEVYQRFILSPPANAWICEINWRDNPWFPAELEEERKQMEFRNPDKYQHVWEGKCQSLTGVMFKREWFKSYDRLPENMTYYLSSDYAVSIGQGDWTEHGVWGMDEHGALYAVDWWSGQTDVDVWIGAWIALVKRWKPVRAFEEKGGILRAVDGAIKRAMRESGAYVLRDAMPSATAKATRAMGFAARCSSGDVYFPRGKPWVTRLVNQLCAFHGEGGQIDDMVDVCSLVGRGIDKVREAQPVRPKPRIIPRDTPFTYEWHQKQVSMHKAENKAVVDYFR